MTHSLTGSDLHAWCCDKGLFEHQFNAWAEAFCTSTPTRGIMDSALDGPDQGVVRTRIDIAPNGSLVRLDTLWSTSARAEQLARQAIQNMPWRLRITA